MKKVLLLLIVTLIFLLFPNAVLAENKAGINIGDHFGDFDKAAAIVGSGGWIVIMACPGDGDKIAQLAQSHPEINIVIRGHYPGQYPPEENNLLAKLWGATLASISFPKKVYFMPWNEPNHENEGGGATAGEEVYRYGQFLKSHFQDLGILDSKVILLSPMVDKLNSSFVSDSFFTNTGGKSAFYNLFTGSSINEYDQFSPGPCSAQPPANNCKYDEIGIPPPYYALETGVAGTCTPPCYKDNELRQMLDRSWLKWKDDGNFKMFAIFSYDPHRTDWDIFSNGTKTVEFLKSVASSGGGCCTQNSSSGGKSSNLNLCPGTQHSFYVESEIECTECGSGESYSFPVCIPLDGSDHESEASKKEIPFNEEIDYGPESECLDIQISGDISVDYLKIPLIKDLTGYLLGESGDVPDPTSFNTLEKSGPLRLLTSKQGQDRLKVKFLNEIIQRGENTKYANFKVKGLNPQQILNKFASVDQKSISQRTGADRIFLSNIWTRIPLFANEESRGNLIFTRELKEGEITEVNRIDTSVPEVYRSEKVTSHLVKMLVPGYNLSSSLSQAVSEKQKVLAQTSGPTCDLPKKLLKNEKETEKGPGESVCILDQAKLDQVQSFENNAEEIVCIPLATDCKQEESKIDDPCCNGNGSCKLNGENVLTCIKNDDTKTQTNQDGVNVVNRVPFLAKIERNTFGKKGFLKIFIPSRMTNPSFLDVAGEPNTEAIVEVSNVKATPLTFFRKLIFGVPEATTKPGILFYRLGTFKRTKEFVANGLLQPKGKTIPIPALPTPSTGSTPDPTHASEGTLNYTIDFRNSSYRISDENKNSVIYGDPDGSPQGVLASWPASQIAAKWDYVYDQAISHGWNPAFVIALWIEESGANGYPGAKGLGCGNGPINIESQLECFFAREYADASFEKFMCIYAEGYNAYKYGEPCVYALNPNFTEVVKYYFDRLTK